MKTHVLFYVCDLYTLAPHSLHCWLLCVPVPLMLHSGVCSSLFKTTFTLNQWNTPPIGYWWAVELGRIVVRYHRTVCLWPYVLKEWTKDGGRPTTEFGRSGLTGGHHSFELFSGNCFFWKGESIFSHMLKCHLPKGSLNLSYCAGIRFPMRRDCSSRTCVPSTMWLYHGPCDSFLTWPSTPVPCFRSWRMRSYRQISGFGFFIVE